MSKLLQIIAWTSQTNSMGKSTLMDLDLWDLSWVLLWKSSSHYLTEGLWAVSCLTLALADSCPSLKSSFQKCCSRLRVAHWVCFHSYTFSNEAHVLHQLASPFLLSLSLMLSTIHTSKDHKNFRQTGRNIYLCGFFLKMSMSCHMYWQTYFLLLPLLNVV